MVLQILKEHQLFSKYNNCEFWLRFVPFLCRIISSGEVEVNRRKTEVVKNWPRPWSPPYIRSFLGLVGCYRRFFDGFASIPSPLTTITQNNVKLECSEACKKNIQIPKDRLTSAPIFTLPEGINSFMINPELCWCVFLCNMEML